MNDDIPKVGYGFFNYKLQIQSTINCSITDCDSNNITIISEHKIFSTSTKTFIITRIYYSQVL